MPTFAYELNDAIADKYLVPPRGVDVPFKFLRRGVKYAELPPEEKEKYEEKIRDEESRAIPASVDAAALNKWVVLHGNGKLLSKELQSLQTTQ